MRRVTGNWRHWNPRLRQYTAAAILDEPGPEWRRLATAQIDSLTALIEQARGAQEFLTNAVDCPTEHPASECGVMRGALDRLLAGAPVDELRA